MRTTHLPLVAALAAACLPAAARADRMDKRLNDEMPAVKKHLQDKGYKNVGVLRFRVQVGKKAARFDNAPFNGNLPVRIENLLIIHGGSSEDGAIGVIRDAGTSASAGKVGDWFGDEKERKKLFDVRYSLAWGDSKVKADAFLTGLVRVSEDLKKTTLSITCFDRDNPEPKEVTRFTMDTDRDVVRDLGLSFVVSRKARTVMEAKRSHEDVDRNVLDSLGGEAKPADVAGIEVTVLVDDKPAEIQAAKGEDGPRWQLASPPADKPIAVRLRNTTDKTMGVVLKLNGMSTFDQQTKPSDRCQKWVIKAGKTATIKGFYSPDGERLSLRPFKVLVGDAANEAKEQLGDKAGLLEVDVFAEGAESGGDDALAISARGLPPSKDKEKDKDKEAKPQSYKAVRASLLKDAKLKTETTVAKREVIVPDREAIKADKFKTVDFEGHSVGRLAVKIVPRE
jgi:hypothetical protein